MDVSDSAAADSVMIALLPMTSDWCSIDMPHMTLVYAGLTADLSQTDIMELEKDTAMLSIRTPPIALQVMSRETFGPDKDTDVFLLKPTPMLLSMRKDVEQWNKSEFPFNPHVTIGPVGTVVNVVPTWIMFDQIMLAVGDEQLTFSLQQLQM